MLGFEGSGAHQRIQVNFLEQGKKWLILSYAKLENLEMTEMTRTKKGVLHVHAKRL